MSQQVNDKVIDQLAHLARLEFNEQDREQIRNDINRMLKFVEKLNEIPTDAVEPLVHMTNEPITLRPDVIQPALNQNDALKNAPLKDSDYFKAPKVIDQNRSA
jgi:aspartyl-tRNA(Asn)/glutamyl-tRNA(Gln) amidotransferase subunit C